MLGGDLRGERRGVRRSATRVCGGVDGDSPTVESEENDGGSAVKTVTRLDVGGPEHGERTE
jgi:hypothetical protein